MIADQNNIDLEKEYSVLLGLIGDNQAEINHISRSKGEIKNFNKINQYFQLNYEDFDEILKRTHYIYIPNYKNKDYKTESSSGSIQLAYNYLCCLIFPEEGYKKEYKLETPIEMPINISSIQLNLKAIQKERESLIQHRNSVFNNLIHNMQNDSMQNDSMQNDSMQNDYAE